MTLRDATRTEEANMVERGSLWEEKKEAAVSTAEIVSTWK